MPADFCVFDANDCIIDLDEVTVIQAIGKGAFGTVDLGVYKGEQVAIKKQVVKTAGLDKYLQSELTILKNVTGHPNLMRFIGAGWRAAENAADAHWIEVGYCYYCVRVMCFGSTCMMHVVLFCAIVLFDVET